MITVLLVLHLFVTLALIGVILIQRSEGGGLGIGTSQGMGAFMGGRSTANLLTRTTAILATLFMVFALTLAILNRGAGRVHSILDLPSSRPAAPTPALPAAPTLPPPAQPASPAAPAGSASGGAALPASPAPTAAPPAAGSGAPASAPSPTKPLPPVPTN